MANTQELCNSFKDELMHGLHALGTCSETRTISTKDALRAALYFTSATIDKTATVYTATGEINDASYNTTGVVVTNATEPALDGDTAHWTPSALIEYANLTEENFNAVLIYNDQFTTKRAISVHVFGDQTIVAGTFQLTMPVPDGTTGLIRLL